MSSGAATSLIAAFVILVTADLSYAYCSQPSAPSCATSYGAFDDEDDFDRCRRDMTRYQSEVESFTQCQSQAAEEAIDGSNKAKSEFNEAVDRFNRRARGY